MTPHSADRAHTISPLDIFGPTALSSGSASQPDQKFEAVLKNVSSSGKNARPPSDRSRTNSASDPSADRQDDDTSAACRAVTKSPRKSPIKQSPPSTPDRPADDDRSEDVPVEQSSAPAATATPAAPQQPATDDSSPDESGEQPEIAAVENDMLAVASAAIKATQDSADQTDSEHQADSEAASGGEEGAGPATKGVPILNVPTADDRLSPRDHAAAVHGNGPLSLAESGSAPATPDASSNSPDPLVAIDGLTVATEERPSSAGEEHSSDQKGPDASADATLQPADSLVPTLLADGPTKSEQANSAAVPPPGSGEAPTAGKENASGAGPNSSSAAAAPQSPSRLPQHVLTRSENHRSHNPAPVPVDSARFISRVAKAFLAAQQRDGEVRLRLSPPELGSLRLQVSVQDGVMVARMETETEAARSSLVNNLPTLRERLAEQGIRVERFDIDLMQRPSTGTPDRPSDPQQQQEPQPLRAPRAASTPVEISSPTSMPSSWNGNGRLNVII